MRIMTTHDERFDRIDAALERMSQRFDGVDGRIENLRQYVVNMRREVLLRFDLIESRLDSVANTAASIDSRLPALAKAVT
jgi:hypothetical protein